MHIKKDCFLYPPLLLFNISMHEELYFYNYHS